jgi:sugar phosphate isomerase/epimerase
MANKYKVAFINDEVSQSLDEVISFAKKNKIHFIELRSLNKKNLLNCSKSELLRIKKSLDVNGLSVSAIASPLFKWLDGETSKKIDSFFFNIHTKGRARKKYIEKAILAAKILNTENIRIFSGLDKSHYQFENDSLLTYLLDLAKKENINILLENEPVCSKDTLKKTIATIRKVGHPNLGLWLDIANAYRMDEVVTEELIQKNKDIIKYIHLKDYIFPDSPFGIFGSGSITTKEFLLI